MEARSSMMYIARTYVLGDGTVAPVQNAPVYQFRDVDNRERATKIADVLEITGEWTCNTDWYYQRCAINNGELEVSYSTDGSSSWSVGAYYAPVDFGAVPPGDLRVSGPNEGAAVDPGATVEEGAAGGGIAESAPATVSAPRTEPAPDLSTSSDMVRCMAIGPECDPMMEPPVLPSDDEVLTTTRALFEAAGYRFDDQNLKLDRSEWNVTVSLVGLNEPDLAFSYGIASLSFDGVNAPNAWGTFIDVDLLGEYPTLDAAAAVDQLNNQFVGGAVLPAIALEDKPASADGSSAGVSADSSPSDVVIGCTPEECGVTTTISCDDPAVACAMAEPMPIEEYTPETVTLTNPRVTYSVIAGTTTRDTSNGPAPADLITVWYLVPNYTFDIVEYEDQTVEVLALDPEFVSIDGVTPEPDPNMTTTTVVDELPVDTSVDTTPTSEPQPVSTTTIGDDRVTSTTVVETTSSVVDNVTTTVLPGE
jgi:hypothetical protein